MSTAQDRANAAQRRASDPAVSAFVAASAGSGKTKLLTDRLLRLMLAGADPARIQCLTFTKAAAAEMALRLQRRLGRWVTLPDEALDAELTALAVVPSAQTRGKARELFARVLDLPGGMRISTIHAFCQSLLRRFPLEARLSPHFGLLADADAAAALVEAQEAVLAHADDMAHRGDLQSLAGLVSLAEFGELVDRLRNSRQWPEFARRGQREIEAALTRALGGEPNEAALRIRAVAWPAETAMREAARAIAEHGSPKVAERALRILDWLGLGAEDRGENWESWRCEFLTGAGEARGMGALLNTSLAKTRPELADVLAAEQTRILGIDDARAAAKAAALSAALIRLAEPVAAAFAVQQGRRRAARLRRPDPAHHGAAGRSGRRLGALQARRRARSSAARRSAGHGAGAMGDRRRADRGILRRTRARARACGAACSRSATGNSRSSPSRAPTPTSSTPGATICASACRRPARRSPT